MEWLIFKDSSRKTVDDATPESELTDDLIEWSTGNKPFFVNIAETVESCANKSKKITLELISGTNVTAVDTLNMI